ncbi:hypothetical protein V6N13_038772 [Hibiscus sabdariffa]|uniref:Uncharacterized protein n=1 Tax=Hibiscus sabdariffa TaxID=183260 RepID=A0ABR2P3F3_9ROSI
MAGNDKWILDEEITGFGNAHAFPQGFGWKSVEDLVLEGDVGPFQFGDWLRVSLARKRTSAQGNMKPRIVFVDKGAGSRATIE